ncbi:MAG: hypothetical protein ACRDGW_09350 [Actinomycetota bacterium]
MRTLELDRNRLAEPGLRDCGEHGEVIPANQDRRLLRPDIEDRQGTREASFEDETGAVRRPVESEDPPELGETAGLAEIELSDAQSVPLPMRIAIEEPSGDQRAGIVQPSRSAISVRSPLLRSITSSGVSVPPLSNGAVTRA